MKRICVLAVLGFVLVIPAAYAEIYDDLHCRSGTVTMLSRDSAATVLAVDFSGMNVKTGEAAQCIGIISIILGTRKGNGYCKFMDTDGDFKLEAWTRR